MKIKKVIVVGAGTMGYALAQTFAQGGLYVYCVDIEKAVVKRALELIESGLLTLEREGIAEKGASQKTLERIKPFVGFDDIPRDVDLIVEAITEDERAKKELFEKLDRLFPPDTILASNTSYLNVFELVRIRNPQRLVITHWFSPPHIIPVVEVVKGPQTSPDTVKRIAALLKTLGKRPIVLEKYVPGFIVNRLQRAIGKEIFFLLDNGIVTPKQLDEAVKFSLGIRIPIIGVVQRYDFAGLDFSMLNQRNKFIAREFNESPSSTLEALVKKGHLGVKSGKGFYDYGGRSQEEILRDRDICLLKMREMVEQLNP